MVFWDTTSILKKHHLSTGIGFLLFLMITLGCDTKVKKNVLAPSKVANTPKKKNAVVDRKYWVGDVDQDNRSDTAVVKYDRNEATDDPDCEGNDCEMIVAFTGKIPEIRFAQSLGIVVRKTEDLNGDGANEILVFSRTNEGWWNEISVWSYKNRVWNEIAKTKGFISQDEDFEHRIVTTHGVTYLIGENQWEEDANGNFKTVKVSIKN